MTVPSCKTCEHCVLTTSGNINDAKCDAVVDPFSSAALNVKTARLDNWNGFTLPCGYAGALWAQKQ